MVNNKLIAEFMGAKYDKDTTFPIHKDDLWLPVHGIVRFTAINNGKTINYHKSWDWLMPVVSKCYEYGELDNHYREEIVASLSGVIDIEDTYKAVVDFVKWYNDNNKPI